MAFNSAKIAIAAAVLYAARRYYRNWGTTKQECRMRLPGDKLVGQPAVQTTEGVWINASAGAVWPWLVQIGQDRGGLYTFQALENLAGLHYRNADRVHPEWQQLAVGDVIRLAPKSWLGLRRGIALPVVEVADQRSIVLHGTPPDLPADVVWSFHLIPHWEDRVRLLIRTRTRLRHPGAVLVTELTGPAKAFINRGLLLGIKHRAERQQQQTGAPGGGLHRVV